MNETVTEWMIELKRREIACGQTKRDLMRQKIYIARHWDPAIFDMGSAGNPKKMGVMNGID